MGIDNNKDINSFSREEQEKMNTFTITKENLGALATDVLSNDNDIEDLSTYSLEELYNKSSELNKYRQIYSVSENKLSYKINWLQAYLNMNLDKNEEIKTKEEIEKCQKEVELIKNKSVQNEKTLDDIKAEIERRLNNESGYRELNNRFFKVFNLVQSQKDWKNNEWLSNRIIVAVIKKDWKEIWKEIRVNRWWEEWKCLFRDNDGNFYKTRKNSGNIENEEQGAWKVTSLKSVYMFLKETNNEIEYNGDSQKIDESDEIEKNLGEKADFNWIPEEIVQEYISKIKKYGKITRFLDENLKKDLWFDFIEWEISQMAWCIYFYVRKLCPNKFREIIPLIWNMLDSSSYIKGQYGAIKKTIWSIKYYWDSAYEYLKFSSPFDGSYMKEWVSNMQGKYFWETIDQMKQRYEKRLEDLPEEIKKDTPSVDNQIKKIQDSLGNDSMLAQYFENFGLEPESINLFSFLKENPQKLENLWWKEIKSIDLSIETWINFAFRGIIEMVKSRPDIEFPHLNENASELEKRKRGQERERIIKEYENMLRNYIAKDEQENADGMKNTFNKIFVSLSQWYMWFSDDKDASFMPSKEWAQQFSWSEVADYSDEDEKYRREETKEIKMISDIEKYAHEHPDEKILVCINHHWGNDWSSENWWTKEDWIRLANISPNIKIRSIRCYFWTAFTNKEIYEQQSSVSWFSNNTVTSALVWEIITDASNKWLWFHEMEIYTRLNYPVSVSPLTESMEYMDWNTWEKKIWKIWLAQNEPIWDEISRNDYT